MKVVLRMNLRLLLAALIVLLLATACGPTPQIRSDKYLADTSLLSGEPCGPPCWRGITPGETSWNDAIVILEDDHSLTGLEVRADEDSERIGAAWKPINGDLCCQMYTETGSLVSFIILQTTPQATLGQLIERHGDPDYLMGQTYTGDQGLFNLYYVDIPMIVYVFVAGENGALTEASEIVGFAYLTPELMQLIIDTDSLHMWEGYQSYKTYMGGEFEVTPRITLTPSDE